MTKNDLVVSNYESIGKYLNWIKKIPTLSRNEELEFFHKLKSGDQTSLEKIVRSNLRFVVGVAKKFRGSGLPFEDLISWGNIGLLNAVDKFDEERGFEFISFAVWYVKAEITKALAETGETIRIPTNLDMSFSYKELEQNDSFTYVTDEEEIFNKSELIIELESILSSLTDLEFRIITSFYGFKKEFPESMKSISESLNMSEENVRRIIRQAEAKLRNHPNVEILRPFLS